jgi:formate-dependent nitrite reductase membrane component NrfD
MLAAVVWTYWISLPLFFGGVAAVAGLVGGYLKKVQSLKAPKR